LGTATAAAEAGDKPASGQSFGSPTYRAYVLVALTLVYTLNFIDRNLLAVIAQPVINTFKLSDSQYGFLNGWPFAIFYAFMGIPIAMAADRFNRVAIIAICIAIWSLMAALCGFATSFVFLLMCRIGVAIGEAGGTPPANSIIGDYFKPRSRANALGIYAMGVTLGGALSNAFGGPIATGLKGETVGNWVNSVGLGGLFSGVDWANLEGWRVAFIVIGAPGLLVALLVALTVKEPPRGYSDPPGAQAVEKASVVDTLKELGRKPTFWIMSLGASFTALVGYGLTGFQAPMVQRIHGIGPGEFALQLGLPLSLCAAMGTFIGGWLAERLTPKMPTAITWLPAVGLLLAIPLYVYAYYLPTSALYTEARTLWCIGAVCHYSYLGAQYTIGQGVVSQRSRASAIAIMLFMIAVIGNGVGPQFTGFMSDMLMTMQIKSHDPSGMLTADICRAASEVAKLAPDAQAVCKAAYGEGLRQSMVATALIFIPAAAFFAASGLTYRKDLVAKPV
jgi:MFS family permease